MRPAAQCTRFSCSTIKDRDILKTLNQQMIYQFLCLFGNLLPGCNRAQPTAVAPWALANYANPAPASFGPLLDMDPFAHESSETCQVGDDRKSRTVSHEFANFRKARALGSRCSLPGLP
jgi:hypothetical protein